MAIYFMNRQENNSYNRVNRAPGARQADKADYQRVKEMYKRIGDSDLRSESGSRVVPERWNPETDSEDHSDQ